jgi:hypothetical protein
MCGAAMLGLRAIAPARVTGASLSMVVSRVEYPRWRFSCGRALQPGLLVPVVECTFPLLLVIVVSLVLPRALLCAAIAALCNNTSALVRKRVWSLYICHARP